MDIQMLYKTLSKIEHDVASLRNEVTALAAKEEKILICLESIKENLNKKEVKRITKKITTQNKPPLSMEEIEQYKKQFSSLFERWMHGEELQVKDILDAFDAQDLRRFADANNLNVTTKMPKQRVLFLIDARFREKKLLMS